MYLTRFEVMMPAGSTGAYEEFAGAIGAFRKGKPGALGQTLLRSYAYPGKYVIMSRWETVEASWELQKTKGYLELLKSAPGGGNVVRPQEGYEGVFNVDADDFQNAQGFTCEVLHDYELDSARKALEFENNRREQAEVQKKHVAGFGSYRLRRSMGSPIKYLGITILKDRESAFGGALNPEMQKFLAQHSARQFLRGPQTMEAYAVIHRI